MRIHDFSHISHILTSTERFMKKLLILLLGLLLLQISYSRSVLIPKNRPELVISKIYNPSSGKILVIYQCKDWLNRVTNSFAAPEFMIRIGSTIMSLSAADYDWPVSTDGSEWVKVTDLNDMPLTAGTKSPYVQQIRITADVNPQTELRPRKRRARPSPASGSSRPRPSDSTTPRGALRTCFRRLWAARVTSPSCVTTPMPDGSSPARSAPTNPPSRRWSRETTGSIRCP